MAEETNSETELKTLAAELKTALGEVNSFAEKAKQEIKDNKTMSEETKSAVDKILIEINDPKGKVHKIMDQMVAADQKLQATLHDIEQKMARRGGHQDAELKSIGQLFVENDGIKAMLEKGVQFRGQVSVGIEVKAITSGVGTVGTGVSAGTSLVPAQRADLVPVPMRRLVVRDLITPGQTASSSIEFAQEQGVFTPYAAMVSEGATKPYANLQFNLKAAPVRTVAVLMKASRQIMDDAPMLQSFIDGRLRYDLAYVEEGELLLGDGTGQHLTGLVTAATAYAQQFTPAGTEQAIDRLRQASLQATLALYPATGYVLHPTDWAKIETLKDTQGRYLVGDPQGRIAKTLWGLPVVDTQAMTVNHFLTGAFMLGAQIFDRMGIEVLLSTENSDDFEKNMITIRGEERLALAIYRPTAFVTGTLP